MDAASSYTVRVPEPDDFDFWRDRARSLIWAGIPPERVCWIEPGGVEDLLSEDDVALPASRPDAAGVRASRRFLALAKNVVLHSEPGRFSLLYRLLWRLQANPRLIEDRSDLDVRWAEDLDKAVRRDSHKMHAFVRFRLVESEDEEADEHYVAWFEPEHHILRANAGFFIRRFANMKWSILTPRGCLHWDMGTLSEGPPAERSDAPTGDPTEDLWRKYYASIFNPARLKIGAMLKEMPRKYWANMPETALIPGLVASAQQRESRMIAAGSREALPRPTTLTEVQDGITQCRACPIGTSCSRAVMGEGPATARLMIVGEQPGDQEEAQGRPFVGPAGQLLDRHLREARIDRSAAYLTNAVKHFKFVTRGKRRLHQSPNANEIDTCRWWLDSERALVRPGIVLALGASAVRGLLGKTVSISQARSRPLVLEDGSELWITTHPSYLLRLDGEAARAQSAMFETDLGRLRTRLNELEA